jgi:hypothetical protein
MIAGTTLLLIGLLLVVCLVFRGAALKSGAIRQTAQGRLLRVKNASLLLVGLMVICLPMSAYEFVGFLKGWNRLGSDEILKVVLLQHVYTAAEMPAEVFWLWVVKQALAWAAGLMLLRLFWLYRQGILFTEKNITCIRFQGYWLIIDNFIDLELQHSIRASSVSLNPLMLGLLVIFVAWIMDECRKIQEEQELTV